MGHITIENSNYKVRINLDGFELGSGNLENLVQELAHPSWNWYKLDVAEEPSDIAESDRGTLMRIDNVNGIIVFGK